MGGGAETNQGGSNQLQTMAPWKGQKPYLLDIYSRASQLSQTPLQQYPGEMVAPEDQATIDAQQLAEARARAGSPLLSAAQGYTQNVLNGTYLGANPWANAQYDQIAGGITRNFNNVVLPAIGSRFGTAGMLGSSNADNAFGQAGFDLGQGLSSAAVDFYGNQYNQERGYQEAARAAAPDLANADYNDINALGNVGAQRQDFRQQLINEAINRFDFSQNEPWQRLGMFSSLLGSPMTGRVSSSGNQWDRPSPGSVARVGWGGKGN